MRRLFEIPEEFVARFNRAASLQAGPQETIGLRQTAIWAELGYLQGFDFMTAEKTSPRTPTVFSAEERVTDPPVRCTAGCALARGERCADKVFTAIDGEPWCRPHAVDVRADIARAQAALTPARRAQIAEDIEVMRLIERTATQGRPS